MKHINLVILVGLLSGCSSLSGPNSSSFALQGANARGLASVKRITCTGKGGFIGSGESAAVSLELKPVDQAASISISLDGNLRGTWEISPYPVKGGAPGISEDGAVSFSILRDGVGNFKWKISGDEFNADYIHCR